MVTDLIPRFVFARPFEPFSLMLTDGREVQVRAAGEIAVGQYILTLYVFHPSTQVKVIDVSHVVSIKTLRQANRDALIR